MDPFPSCSSDIKGAIKRDKVAKWTPELTIKLIETLESDCRELWDAKHPLHKDKFVRQARYEMLANTCDTTVEEITRKVHNMRTQFNSEIRKLKKRKQLVGEDFAATSSWEYFEPLAFLLSQNSLETTLSDSIDSVDLAVRLAEFQEAEQAEFSPRSPPRSPPEVKHVPAPIPPPPVVHPVRPVRPVGRANVCREFPLEDAQPRLTSLRVSTDECQVFGDFVASELRMLRSEENRKKLKRAVQKAILEIGEEDDMAMFR